jgi:hypothetical protein
MKIKKRHCVFMILVQKTLCDKFNEKIEFFSMLEKLAMATEKRILKI